MTKLKYYYDLLSQPSRALWMAMKLSNIPFEEKPVSIKSGDLRTKEFKEINRFQKVPCIVDGDFKLAESVAILRYLDGLGLLSEQLYPKNLKERARVDEYLEWQHLNTRLNGFMYFQHLLRPLFAGKEVIPQRLQTLEGHFQKTLDNIENIWLKSSKYIASDKNLTIADIFAACEIEQPIITGLDAFKNRPKLVEWMNRVKEETKSVYEPAHVDARKFKKIL